MAENINWKVQLFKLNFDETEISAVTETLRSGWITMGQKTLDFETAYERELGGGVKALAVSNGTAALHISVLAAGIKPGDEVIVPALTFIADLNSVYVSGGKVVLADITSDEDFSMDPEDIERKITPKTKALMIVHYAGYSCDMDAITDICRRKNLVLIEDCAHAPGGEYKGKKLGTFGDLSAWSFFSNKNISVGEGGMVVTKDPALYQKCKNLRSHGMTVASFDRIKGRAVSYDVVEPGFNYRIDEMRSALGLVQLSKLKKANKRREEITKQYFRTLKEVKEISFPFINQDRGLPTYHIMPTLLNRRVDRTKLIESLKKDGIQTSIHYPSIQSFTAYKDIVEPTPKAQAVCERELTLPLYPSMTDEEVGFVCDSLLKNIKTALASV